MGSLLECPAPACFILAIASVRSSRSAASAVRDQRGLAASQRSRRLAATSTAAGSAASTGGDSAVPQPAVPAARRPGRAAPAMRPSAVLRRAGRAGRVRARCSGAAARTHRSPRPRRPAARLDAADVGRIERQQRVALLDARQQHEARVPASRNSTLSSGVARAASASRRRWPTPSSDMSGLPTPITSTRVPAARDQRTLTRSRRSRLRSSSLRTGPRPAHRDQRGFTPSQSSGFRTISQPLP